jgi:hypothetical protein
MERGRSCFAKGFFLAGHESLQIKGFWLLQVGYDHGWVLL